MINSILYLITIIFVNVSIWLCSLRLSKIQNELLEHKILIKRLQFEKKYLVHRLDELNLYVDKTK